jgi:outer membrane protein TolC
LNWSLFEGSDRPRQKKVLLASKGRVEYERDAAMLKLIGMIRRSEAKMATTLGNMPYSEESLEMATSFAQEIRLDYFSSKRSYLEMVDAINLKLQNELDRIENRYEYRQSAARLLRLCGWKYGSQEYPASVILISRLRDANL